MTPLDTLLIASVELLVLGLGTVFVILGLLIACMSVLRWVAPVEDAGEAVDGAGGAADRDAEIAAMQAAIHLYRRRR